MRAKEEQPAQDLASASSAPRSKLPVAATAKPLLLIDVDGVLSLFGPSLGAAARAERPDRAPPAGYFHSIEGIPHFLSSTAGAHLLSLAPLFELVWASGWEERANEHLPRLLGLPEELPYLRFGGARGASGGSLDAHWKLEAIDAYAGARPLAWIDDAFNAACREWAAARPAATLLVQTAPAEGLTARQARQLAAWAQALERA